MELGAFLLLIATGAGVILTNLYLIFGKPWAKAYAATAAVLFAREERSDKIVQEGSPFSKYFFCSFRRCPSNAASAAHMSFERTSRRQFIASLGAAALSGPQTDQKSDSPRHATNSQATRNLSPGRLCT